MEPRSGICRHIVMHWSSSIHDMSNPDIRFDRISAVGAIVAPVALAGVIYALYPNGFNPNNIGNGGVTSTASSSIYGSGATHMANTPSSTSTANQATTSQANTPSSTSTANQATTSQGSASNPQSSGKSGY